MAKPELDQTTLRHLLEYDPVSGGFTWLPRHNARGWNTRYAGKPAGYEWEPKSGPRYWVIRVLDWPFMAHRLAVLYMTGAWPPTDVDHIDGDGLNNKWENLRLASKSQNGANRGPNRNNKSGFKGVSLKDGRYCASLRGRLLGYCDTPEEAAKLYAAAAAAEFGPFARTS